MDQLSQMVVFARVVDARGFARAARMMGLSTSSVSRSVSSLEAHVGGRLLNRTTRSISMTELGAEVYAKCAQIAETAREVATLADHYAAAPQGLLRVTAPVVVGQVMIAPLLPGFLTAHPQVDVDLVLTDEFIDLVEAGMDVAVRLPIETDLASGMIARALASTTMLLVATPRYLERTAPIIRPEQLGDHEFLFPGGLHAPAELHFRRGDEEVSVARTSRLTANNGLALLAAIEGDYGVGVIPNQIARSGLASGRLVRVLPEWTLAGRLPSGTLHIVYAPTRHLPKKVRVFIDYLLAATRND